MSTGNYPPAGQPESAGRYVEPNPPGETPAHVDANTGHGTAPDTAGVQAPNSTPSTTPPPARPATNHAPVTRAGVVWAAVVAALVLLILLIIFILQNQDLVLVRYFGFEGTVPLGMALFIASVSGAVVVAVAGGARILQLRRNAHRARAAQRR
ncbi:lipopolysaccharide assembly protein LapA domain-containing protein [Pseudarthrobacter sp. fls2-241-R2A-168]|uniref:lipopolysaccharide assembly protein LapA domain-containing protein n=1 Tax=Pseudarthrobacter sp. fls2-241-R2A-168 TaxID=3040304 RepID=UPI0025566A02|nr:lipopolysaccharide assembly protein LapA domain-containing protein [Pseudarthrobacter sp. fls2-241-R2A-168]